MIYLNENTTHHVGKLSGTYYAGTSVKISRFDTETWNYCKKPAVLWQVVLSRRGKKSVCVDTKCV